MQRKPPAYNPQAQAEAEGNQTAIDFDACPAKPVEPVADPAVEAEPPPEYTIRTGWVDTAKRIRTWALYEPSGEKLGEITTKIGAQKIADLLNRVESKGNGRGR